ncbi:hypothetical protein HanRHA438_Chr04g0186721 [Helianthus annuus]|nr:hypothetical protein HanHA300_Chr04g0144891 [Helianthus annuus]KAJ0597749.1 hypothetical protein HanHA89_Chr04g0158201 [Helianthus annuus]KAJ0762050.1 hypothetical protein HanOQP8_Chr04g0157091 [Helianthus annuus]KAJ0797200.1 hypothetical protein HanPI659440_Chr04g0171131 [Helianthus annuus]KAJ0927773.1 hypothetical protein HanRHA438_Chr04g0186721 [Helianthus annuus]
MDGITTRVYRRVERYWRRKPYIRLGGNSTDETGLNRPRRFWRIRVTSKLKLRYSPKKLLTGIRDGYMNMMMRMANSQVVAGSGGFGEGVAKFGMTPVKEYDDKLIMEIYKTLALRQAQLATNDGSEIGVGR